MYINYYNKALEEGPTMFDKQGAAKILFTCCYHYGGDKEQLRRYAMRYMELSDTLDFRVRQQEAATTNNRYKYFKNREEELRLQEEKDRYRMWLIGVSALSLVVVFGLLAAFTHRRNRRLRQLLEKTKELKAASHDRKGLGYALVMTIFGPVVGVSLSLMAVRYTSAGIASTLMALTPVFILLPYALIYHQRIKARELLGVAVSMTGVALFFLL